MTKKFSTALVFNLFLLAIPAALAQPAPEDARQLVSMPDTARAIMRTDMIDHLAAMTEILGYLAKNNLAAASETAENRLGNSSKGRHAVMAPGQGPGRFMPDTMRQMGWTMHAAASDFARVAKEGDAGKTLAALQQVTSSCMTCHTSFRTR